MDAITLLTQDHRAVDSLLARLTGSTGATQRRSALAASRELARTKESVPTRPHPAAPSTPPLSELVGKPAAALDRARDRAADR